MSEIEEKVFNKKRRQLRRAVVRAAMEWEDKAEGDEGVSSLKLSEACQSLKAHEAQRPNEADTD